MLLNQQKRPPRKYCCQSSEITACRNKISLKLGYPTVNARKYVRGARTFLLINRIHKLLHKFVVLRSYFDLPVKVPCVIYLSLVESIIKYGIISWGRILKIMLHL